MKEEIKKLNEIFFERQMKKKARLSKMYGMHQKQFLEGSLQGSQAYLRKPERSKVNDLTLRLKQLEKEKQTKPQISIRNEITKIRTEINEIETKSNRKNQQY